MVLLARLYLRASTDEQDASRARAAMEAFANERGLPVAATYVENESGAKLARPELFRLLADSRPGDVLLTEQVDRLSRLTEGDWRRLRAEIEARQVRVVALDLPTSWMLAAPADDFTGRMFAAVSSMMLDVLAAVARKDYDDRRRRQAEGQAKAKAAGAYKGRAEDVDRNNGIAAMLAKGVSWSQIQAATGCSRATVAKIAKRSVGVAGMRSDRATVPAVSRLTAHILAAMAEEEARMMPARTNLALAAAKAREVKLDGVRKDADRLRLYAKQAGTASGAARREKAADYVAELAPILAELDPDGSMTLGQLASALTAREVPTIRGGPWSAVQVHRLKARIGGTA